MAVVVSMLDIKRADLEKGVAAIRSEMREPLEQGTEGHFYLDWHNHIATARLP